MSASALSVVKASVAGELNHHVLNIGFAQHVDFHDNHCDVGDSCWSASNHGQYLRAGAFHFRIDIIIYRIFFNIGFVTKKQVRCTRLGFLFRAFGASAVSSMDS